MIVFLNKQFLNTLSVFFNVHITSGDFAFKGILKHPALKDRSPSFLFTRRKMVEHLNINETIEESKLMIE